MLYPMTHSREVERARRHATPTLPVLLSGTKRMPRSPPRGDYPLMNDKHTLLKLSPRLESREENSAQQSHDAVRDFPGLSKVSAEFWSQSRCLIPSINTYESCAAVQYKYKGPRLRVVDDSQIASRSFRQSERVSGREYMPRYGT